MEESDYGFSFITADGVTFNIDRRIIKFSKLFDNILQDYELENNGRVLENIYHKDLLLLNTFAQSINYDHTHINLRKPFALNDMDSIKTSLFKSTEGIKIEQFYNNLNSLNIVDYDRVADFFDVRQLEDLIYLKLHEIFTSKENIETFFKDELKGKENVLSISHEKEKMLKNNYMIYCEKYVSNLTDDEVSLLLDKELIN